MELVFARNLFALNALNLFNKRVLNLKISGLVSVTKHRDKRINSAKLKN